MKWVCYGLRKIESKSRRECMDSCRIDVLGKLDRFVTIETCTCSVAARARSLHSDRAWLELGHYIATKRDARSVSTWRPNLARARSLRSNRMGRALGRYVATEQCACLVTA
ncbi:hypothetical protein F2Q69_00054339 [Brassica cretica]|uniref:Uncharacterized protein n=1 Tax=Brassica cretica TaxID=69181 RepID=A0A8S9N2J5_BRACR|nr:hypothetical protein F2Q69_00054339 [Brassica cretica]